MNSLDVSKANMAISHYVTRPALHLWQYVTPPDSQLMYSDSSFELFLFFYFFFTYTTETALVRSVLFPSEIAGFCQHCIKASKRFQETINELIKNRHLCPPLLSLLFSMSEVPT